MKQKRISINVGILRILVILIIEKNELICKELAEKIGITQKSSSCLMLQGADNE